MSVVIASAMDDDPYDLSTLDGKALVARLAVVKHRSLGDSVEAHAIGSTGALAERADTKAVIDECAARLLSTTVALRASEALYAEAVELAASIRSKRDQSVAHLVRLRRLIRAAVASLMERGSPLCPLCLRVASHLATCPLPGLIAETEED